MRLIEAIVDALPDRLWKPANLYVLPGGDWHLCVGNHPRLQRSVRTVEWRGREVARGRKPFDPTQHEDDLIERVKSADIRWTRSLDDPFLLFGSAAGTNFSLRINDFPDEVMFTLSADGTVIDEFDERPSGWHLPPTSE